MTNQASVYKVSEMHAQFHHKDGAFFLTDLRSVHGTWITKLTMKEGDTGYLQMIKLASFRVKVISSTPRASQNEGAPIYQQV
ncbi:hypothetical protein AHAS_Ahas06G0051000 [Arachis hypogaea]